MSNLTDHLSKSVHASRAMPQRAVRLDMNQSQPNYWFMDKLWTSITNFDKTQLAKFLHFFLVG